MSKPNVVDGLAMPVWLRARQGLTGHDLLDLPEGQSLRIDNLEGISGFNVTLEARQPSDRTLWLLYDGVSVEIFDPLLFASAGAMAKMIVSRTMGEAKHRGDHIEGTDALPFDVTDYQGRRRN